MSAHDVHAAILDAAFAEHGDLPTEVGTLAFTEAAESISDALYRLCVEFGVSFNTFKQAVLDEIPNRQRAASVARSASAAKPLLDGARVHAELAVLALELMRDDSDLGL